MIQDMKQIWIDKDGRAWEVKPHTFRIDREANKLDRLEGEVLLTSGELAQVVPEDQLHEQFEPFRPQTLEEQASHQAGKILDKILKNPEV